VDSADMDKLFDEAQRFVGLYVATEVDAGSLQRAADDLAFVASRVYNMQEPVAGYKVVMVPLMREICVRVPGSDGEVLLAVDIWRPDGSEGDCFQMLAYAAGEDDPAVAVRFGDDGSVEEVQALETGIRMLDPGQESPWIRRRDDTRGIVQRGPLVVPNDEASVLVAKVGALEGLLESVAEGAVPTGRQLEGARELAGLLGKWTARMEG
jgi:hypothetical protein